MADFVPSLQLNAAFYEQVVRRLVGDRPHSAALLGWGSDVLGYDTARSPDHGWGPRLQVFVGPDDVVGVRQVVESSLPETFGGWPVRYGWDDHAVRAHVEVTTLGDWLRHHLGIGADDEPDAVDWLVMPQQLLLGVTGGAVYHDGLGRLAELRRRLAWYPAPVERWLVACQWRRIAQEEAFVGRAAEVGDELGARLVAARLVRELVRLAFLLARRYWPYSKWLGTAFAQLDDPDGLGGSLSGALEATDRATREAALVEASETLARRQNTSGWSTEVDPTARPFHGRPYRVIGADRLVDACLAAVADPWLRSLPLVGSIDQLVDSTDVLSDPETARRLRGWYESLSRGREGRP